MTRDFFFSVCSSPTSSGPYVYENFTESVVASAGLLAGSPQSRLAPFKPPWMRRLIPCNDVCLSSYSLTRFHHLQNKNVVIIQPEEL